jgi:two-component system sensor histidine kinase/response regulator
MNIGVALLIMVCGLVLACCVWRIRPKNSTAPSVPALPQNYSPLEAIKNALFQSNLSAIVAIDEQDRIVEFNPSAEQLFMRRRDDVLGQLMGELLVPPQYRQRHYAGMKRFLHTGQGMVVQKRIEVSALNAIGNEFPIEMEITPVATGAGQYIFVAVMNDITERNLSTAKIQQALAQAEDANRAKSRFLTSVSHEVRTPLHAVLGLIECLEHTALNDQQFQYIATAKTAGENLLNMVNDILDLGQIEAGKREAHFSMCNPRQLLDEHLEIYRQRAQEKGLSLYLIQAENVPRQIYTDMTMLRQILSNLLSNACKYTQAGAITVRSWCQTSAKDSAALQWCCAVDDTGPGFSAEQLQALFQEFVRFHQNSSTSGSGVGLMICRLLVEQLGGQLTVSSEQGEGASFQLTLPILQTAQRRKFKILQNLCIFLCSDNSLWLQCLQLQLEALGVNNLTIISIKHFDTIPAGAVVLLDTESRHGSLPFQPEQLTPIQQSLKIISAGSDLSTELANCSSHFAFVIEPYLQQDLLIALRATIAGRKLVPVTHRSATSQLLVAPAQTKRAYHVLLTDDSEVNRLTIRTFLGLEGIKVTEALNGLDAVEKVRQHHFDLLLMDMAMPVMNGLDAVTLIRQQKLAEGTPIIALTAHVQEHEKQQCLAAGMQDFLTKPIGKALLVKRVMYWLMKESEVPETVENKDNQTILPWLYQEVLNEKTLLQLKQDLNTDRLIDLVDIFCREASKRITEIQKFLEDSQYDSIEISVHALKSSAQMFGAARLSELAKMIEKECREKRFSTASSYCQYLSDVNQLTQQAFSFKFRGQTNVK